ncbi:unnamed protein product [Brachionus calyciflorus]|uniref:Reverse transcriptase domain-containing protein n=1 Tax=Brachionus calyciflorus TaxID=104777 RepID=A0A813XGK4_9BILA|nr:unnamed protein product [Brachionus calyciflorus]
MFKTMAFIELFVDDTTLAKSGEKFEEILKDFEQIIEDLNEWCYFNKIDMNWNKTFVMIFTKKKIEISKKIEIKGASIAVVKAIQRLANCFYLCIYKLLRIGLNSSNFNDLNNLLEIYGLFAFQHRALERMLSFSYKIINFANAPPLLKEQLVKNETRNLNYELRNKDQKIECGSRTKSGEKTFRYIYSRLCNKFIVDKLVLKFSTFKLSMFNNINLIYEKSIKIFDK